MVPAVSAAGDSEHSGSVAVQGSAAVQDSAAVQGSVLEADLAAVQGAARRDRYLIHTSPNCDSGLSRELPS